MDKDTNTNYDFILLIFNCKRYEYKAQKQRDTWLKDFTLMPYFHVIGIPNLQAAHLFDVSNHMLYIRVEDDYVSLPKKVILAYEAIYHKYPFNYIFKTDDDQHLTNIKFLSVVKNMLLSVVPKIHYAGNVVDVKHGYMSKYHTIHPELPTNLPVLPTKYCSGRFYILSNLAVHSLITEKGKIMREYLEDYAIGYYLNSSLKTRIKHIQTNTFFIDNLDFSGYNTSDCDNNYILKG